MKIPSIIKDYREEKICDEIEQDVSFHAAMLLSKVSLGGAGLYTERIGKRPWGMDRDRYIDIYQKFLMQTIESHNGGVITFDQAATNEANTYTIETEPGWPEPRPKTDLSLAFRSTGRPNEVYKQLGQAA
jgi:hypothetical protein